MGTWLTPLTIARYVCLPASSTPLLEPLAAIARLNPLRPKFLGMGNLWDGLLAALWSNFVQFPPSGSPS